MTDIWPQVSILIITYKRLDVVTRTIRALGKNLRYTGPIHWHVADDGSGQEYIDKVGSAILLAQQAMEITGPITYTDAQRKGVGVSMNMGQHTCWSMSDYVLWLEDDWYLKHEFDLHPCVRFLHEHANYGMIRLGYLQVGLKAKTVSGCDRLWWSIDRESDDPFIFTGHASLRHKRFYEAYGDYNPGYTPGNTECDYAYRFLQKAGPDIVYPALYGNWGPFDHIGEESLKDVKPE